MFFSKQLRKDIDVLPIGRVEVAYGYIRYTGQGDLGSVGAASASAAAPASQTVGLTLNAVRSNVEWANWNVRLVESIAPTHLQLPTGSTLRTNHGLLLRHNPTFCMADKLCTRTAVGRSSGGGGGGIKSTDLKAAGLQQFFWTPSAQQYFLAILKTTFCMATAGTLELPTSR
jgi:hypothetical protein